MRIVITGVDGFIGKNLRVRLRELGHTDVVGITRYTPASEAQAAYASADFVFHLAGVNRPNDPAEFAEGNDALTGHICKALTDAGRHAPLVLASSTQATRDNLYGVSKRAAEAHVRAYSRAAPASVYVFRLTNVFGKWARPDYNSAVATFCHNISRGLPITVNDPAAPLQLVYIDDVVASFVAALERHIDVEAVPKGSGGTSHSRDEFFEAGPVYATTVGAVADALRSFADSRVSLSIPEVGTGLLRALYSTYVSYLPTERFAYPVARHADARGVFVEMLKTPDCGQFSYFTAHPGITRGEHYHHSKTEKFLVIKGSARFAFRQIETGQTHEIVTQGGDATIVETVPGWTHNITNIGTDELIVMLWANEIFDRQKPDTIAMKV